MDILTISHAAATNSLKDAFFKYIKNMLIRSTLKGTLKDLSIRNPERWRQVRNLMEAITQSVSSSRAFTNSLATLVRNCMETTVDEWRQNSKNIHHTEEKPSPMALPSLPDTRSTENLQAVARRKLERVHLWEHRSKIQKFKTDKYMPTYSISSCRWKVRLSGTGLSADRSDQRKEKYEDVVHLTLLHFPVHKTVKYSYICALDYHTYNHNDHSPRYEE